MPRMFGRRVRGFVGAYLAAFFLVVAAAPHHHVNDAEDLLLDQRSDSGILVRVEAVSLDSRSGLIPGRLDRDVPCLACFSGDFVAAPAPAIAFLATLTPLAAPSDSISLPTPRLLVLDTSSRAPPAVS